MRAHSLKRRFDMNNCSNDEDGQLSRRHASRHARRFIDEGSMLASYFFDDEEDEEELVLLQQPTTPPKPLPKWIHRRLNWESHLQALYHERLFKRTYRMSQTAFEKLRDMLGDMLIIVQARQCPIPEALLYPEIIMAIGLLYLSGGKCLDLKNVYSVSLPSVYRICDLFINAVNSCSELIKGIKLPETVGEMAAIAAAFQRFSTSGTRLCRLH